MKSNSVLSLIALAIFLCFSVGCKKKEDPDDKKDPEFDRSAMLSNIGNNIVIPNYESLKLATHKLDSATTAFNANPDNANLTNLQNLFKDAYRAWQKCSMFDIGPAETEYLRNTINTFPTDSIQIKSNITNGGYDLAAIANWDAKGLPALDYLLFGLGTDNTAILDKYISDAEAAQRKLYLANVSEDIDTKVNTVLTAWLSGGGNYLNTFINANGTDIGSSVGMLINELNYDFEITKNYRIGLPLGKQTGDVPNPGKVEALYCGISSELALLHVKALENLFLGRSNLGIDGLGFDDYVATTSAVNNGVPLADAIKNQYAVLIAKFEDLPDPLSVAVVSNSTVVNAAYIECPKLTVLTKTDMPSALGVLITYVDNDGD